MKTIQKTPLLSIAAFCLIPALILGVLSGWIVAHPVWAAQVLPFQIIRPLHTLFAFHWIILGAAAVAQIVVGKRPGKLQTGLFGLGLVLTVGLVTVGYSSGREYLSWPAAASLPMLLGLVLAVFALFPELPKLARRNVEAAWMLGIGILLLPLGFAEAHLFLLPSVGLDPARDLTVQWHGLDTMFGAWNTLLFGAGSLITRHAHQPGRRWHRILFIVAVSGILLTYSHHHYASPQPRWLKDIAFYSSLLAACGFVYHLKIWRRCPRDAGLSERLLHMAGIWTLFAIATGFLMALPPINTITHGTYVVVAHSMGSMIGINSAILLAVALHTYPPAANRVNRCQHLVKATHILLCLFVAELMISGLTKGYLRTTGNYQEFRFTVQDTLVALPYLGFALSIVLIPIAWAVVRQPPTVHHE